MIPTQLPFAKLWAKSPCWESRKKNPNRFPVATLCVTTASASGESPT